MNPKFRIEPEERMHEFIRLMDERTQEKKLQWEELDKYGYYCNISKYEVTIKERDSRFFSSPFDIYIEGEDGVRIQLEIEMSDHPKLRNLWHSIKRQFKDISEIINNMNNYLQNLTKEQ